jgi:CubicO group peptidase (beta-lactamase class C family)
MYAYLEARHSKGFMLLKDGKIVLEKYFGTFTADSGWYWASAGKSLTATLVGIAQQENLLNINNTVSSYLGNGWTSAPVNKESLITVKHLLAMTSGLNDDPPSPCGNEDTAASCLLYLADAGTRWSYHTGAYKKLQAVVSTTSGMTYTVFTNNRLANRIGMAGFWLNGVYYSRLRSMARFGLLISNNGVWSSDTILRDFNYFTDMTHSSQSFNQAYGYLWWLNGQSSLMAPGLQTVFQRELFANGPDDMICALGKNDQKIYIAPSRGLVVVRMGDAAYSSVLAFSDFDNELWAYINNLSCTVTNITDAENYEDAVRVYPNPVQAYFTIELPKEKINLKITDCSGRVITELHNVSGTSTIDCSQYNSGVYFLQVAGTAHQYTRKFIKQ